ncbi:transposase [Streptomyces sp. NPDC006261]|uniref:transposase n=1 Tax=Streptomyces sp. NPDC006261 TaxID=3156739 RepID=UPI0033B26653
MGRPTVWSRRQLIDGMRFRVRTGVPWRDVPVGYGPWGRIYDLFRRWQRDGTWHPEDGRDHTAGRHRSPPPPSSAAGPVR